jgi:hypothetical protein
VLVHGPVAIRSREARSLRRAVVARTAHHHWACGPDRYTRAARVAVVRVPAHAGEAFAAGGAVFVVREVFDSDYPHIGQMVDRNEANCHRVFDRARQRAWRRSIPGSIPLANSRSA